MEKQLSDKCENVGNHKGTLLQENTESLTYQIWQYDDTLILNLT